MTLNHAQNFYPHLPTLRLALKAHAASEACHSTRRRTAGIPKLSGHELIDAEGICGEEEFALHAFHDRR